MFGKSKKLCVRVMEADKQIVAVRLPAVTVGWMEKLMPQHVLDKLAERQIDLEEIKQKAKSSDMTPQDLFQMASGQRTYRVWLE